MNEFSNVWGEYKYHDNPYIQGTTIPCDVQCKKSADQIQSLVTDHECGLYTVTAQEPFWCQY